MLIPAIDAIDEHIYLNIGASLGTGSGASRLNALGVNNIGAWLNSNKSYSLITNKKHRILHIVGGGSGMDNRGGDAGVPWTNTDENYFYDIYYESDQRHTAIGFALTHCRVFNMKTGRVSSGTTAANSIHEWYELDCEHNNTTTLTLFHANTAGGGAAAVNTKMRLYNAMLKFVSTGGRLFDGANTNFMDFEFYGGCLAGNAYTNTQSFSTINSGCGVTAKFYNFAYYRLTQPSKFVEYQSGYVAGSKIPAFDFYDCAANASSFVAALNLNTSNMYFGLSADDMFVDAANDNFFVPPNSTLIGAGSDLTLLADYGYVDRASWDVGLAEKEPIPGALLITEMVSSDGSKVARVGGAFTVTAAGAIGESPGSGILKNYSAEWECALNVDSWDSISNEIVFSVPLGADFRFNDDDNILYVARDDAEPFNPLTAVALLGPIGTNTINGDNPSSEDNSIFKNAGAVPTGMYQIRWRDPDGTGAQINSFGEVVSILSSGVIFVSIWDSTDNTTSVDYEFTVLTEDNGSGVSDYRRSISGQAVRGTLIKGKILKGVYL